MTGLAFLWGVWLLFAALSCLSVARFLWASRREAEGKPLPPVVIVVPVKGGGPSLAGNLRAFLAQDHPAFRFIFSVEAVEDPAWPHLVACRDKSPHTVDLVVAGPAPSGGQKVWNQRAALRRLRRGDRIVVFADADIRPDPEWLARLVGPLPGAGLLVTTGYRWLEPVAGSGLAAALASVANSSVATMVRPLGRLFGRHYGAWGGSMALTCQTMNEIGLQDWWNEALSDDLQLTAAVVHAGGRVRRMREVMPLTPIDWDLRQALAFGRRQYQILRTHAPVVWLYGALTTTVPLAGWLTAVPLAVTGNRVAQLSLFGVVLLDILRALLRRRVVFRLWGADGIARLRVPLLLALVATPLWLLLHAVAVWSSAFGRHVDWAGIRYRIDAPNRVKIVSRAP